jgi:5-formyltetrahydrofolate cyclo-ligase
VQNSQLSPDDLLIEAQKRQLRREAQKRRDALEGRATRSAVISALVEALPAYQATTAIHCFLAIRSEVETRPLIAAALAAGKAVAMPMVDPQGVLRHSWIDSLHHKAFTSDALGMPQPWHPRPAYPGDWQLTLVPLLAFDRAGYRLGYGKGYYDRLLIAAGGLAVGLAFACQELPNLPRAAHDHPLDLIVTEEGLITPFAST